MCGSYPVNKYSRVFPINPCTWRTPCLFVDDGEFFGFRQGIVISLWIPPPETCDFNTCFLLVTLDPGDCCRVLRVIFIFSKNADGSILKWSTRPPRVPTHPSLCEGASFHHQGTGVILRGGNQGGNRMVIMLLPLRCEYCKLVFLFILIYCWTVDPATGCCDQTTTMIFIESLPRCSFIFAQPHDGFLWWRRFTNSRPVSRCPRFIPPQIFSQENTAKRIVMYFYIPCIISVAHGDVSTLPCRRSPRGGLASTLCTLQVRTANGHSNVPVCGCLVLSSCLLPAFCALVLSLLSHLPILRKDYVSLVFGLSSCSSRAPVPKFSHSRINKQELTLSFFVFVECWVFLAFSSFKHPFWDDFDEILCWGSWFVSYSLSKYELLGYRAMITPTQWLPWDSAIIWARNCFWGYNIVCFAWIWLYLYGCVLIFIE